MNKMLYIFLFSFLFIGKSYAINTSPPPGGCCDVQSFFCTWDQQSNACVRTDSQGNWACYTDKNICDDFLKNLCGGNGGDPFCGGRTQIECSKTASRVCIREGWVSGGHCGGSGGHAACLRPTIASTPSY